MDDIMYLMARLEYKKMTLKAKFPAKFGPQSYRFITAEQKANKQAQKMQPPKTFDEVFGQ